MNEELKRIEQGLIHGHTLDAYDRDLIIRIINEQHKRINRYWKALDEICAEYQVGNANPTAMFKTAKEALQK